jgi:glycopeptide antibiotics resistance protein
MVGAWLLWMTLRPMATVSGDLAAVTQSAAARRLTPHLLIQVLGNVVVFVPLGFLAAIASAERRPRFLWALGVGSGLSLCIELAQLLIPTRMSGVDDWLLNTIGTALGAGLALALTTRHSREKRHTEDGAEPKEVSHHDRSEC